MLLKTVLSTTLAIAIVLSPSSVLAGTKDRLNNLEAQYPLLERRLIALEKQLNNQGLLELMQTVQLLQSELQQLQGDVEQLRYDVEGMSKRQKDLYLDIDRRLNDLSLGSVPGVTVNTPATEQTTDTNTEDGPPVKLVAQPLVSNTETTVSPVLKRDPKIERQDYEKAFALLRESRYPEAISAFDTFIKQSPKSVYAPNAQYWLGKLHYVTKNFDSAITELNKVLTVYTGSSKEPDARLNLGYTYYEMQDWANARKMLESVISKYPNSSAVKLAEQRLQALTSAGH